MAAEFTYGVYPLLSPSEGPLAEFMRRYIDPDDFGLMGHKPVATANGNWRPTVAKYRRRGGFSVPNYPPPPTRFRINSLYWPTGASRWAICYVMVDGETLAGIRGDTNDFTDAAYLTLNDGASEDNQGIAAPMFGLAPRRINCVPDLDDKENLYILPLVDERWFWQFKHMGEIDKPDDVTTWAQLYSWIATRLGISLSAETVSSDYDEPEKVEIERWHDNPAMMLDAVAHSVGHRILAGHDGTYSAVSFSEGEQNLEDNQDSGLWKQIAGYPLADVDARTVRGGKAFRDDLAGITPSKVLVVAPIVRIGVPSNTLADSLRALISKEVSADTHPGPDERYVAATTKVFHTTYAARYEFDDTSATNDSDLQALAEKIASDFYDSLAHAGLDFTFAGILPWSVTPWDDHVRWDFGCLRDDGTLAIQTRVVPAPYNLGVEDMAHSDGGTDEHGPLISFVTQESFTTSDGTVSVKIEHWDGGAWDVVGDAFDVYNHVGRFSGATSGLHGEARWDETRQGYLMIQLDCG